MTTFLYLVPGLIVLAIIVRLIWIWRRDALPCPTWLSWIVEMDNPFTEVNRALVILEHLDLVPGMKVLDAGCGPGRLTLPLAELLGHQGEVTALDIQGGMLARVRQKVETAGLQNVKFVHAGLGEGKLHPAFFDRAVLVSVLGEIQNREAAMKEIYDALKPGGMLSITEVVLDPHFQGCEAVLKIVQTVGFKKKKLFGSKWAYTIQLEKSPIQMDSENYTRDRGVLVSFQLLS